MPFTPEEDAALRAGPFGAAYAAFGPGIFGGGQAAQAQAGDDDDEWTDEETAWLNAIMAEADAIDAQEQAAAPPEGELSAAGLSNAAAMGRVIAGQLARRGDIEGAIGAHAAAIELSNEAAGQGSIDLAGGHDHRGRSRRPAACLMILVTAMSATTRLAARR